MIALALSIVLVLATWSGEHPSPTRADRDVDVYVWVAEEVEHFEAAVEYATAHEQAQRAAQQQQLSTPPSPSWPWDALAQCESGGNWSINTGNGYYGGLQFTLTSWRAVGGTGYPHEHSRDEQIRRGAALQSIQGWGAWPACARRLGLR